MKDLRLAQLIIALSPAETDLIRSQLKIQANKFYLPLFFAFEQLRNTSLTREEVYLRVYKKKWSVKADAAFRTDQSRLADLIEDILIRQRLLRKLDVDRQWYEEERMALYADLKLDKEVERQYRIIESGDTFSLSDKNRISAVYAEYIIRNNLPLKEKVRLFDSIIEADSKRHGMLAEIEQARYWFLRCMHNYYHKQLTNQFYESIDIKDLLKKANGCNSIEAKYTLISGVAYMKIDSTPEDISMETYEAMLHCANLLFNLNASYLHYKIKALHLTGTRYSILGDFRKGNTYFEEGIQIIPENQYHLYKTIILNYATNCSKLKQFDKAVRLIQLLDAAASRDSNLKTECAIRSLSCYLFMEDANAIHQLIKEQDYQQVQPHEKIYFRLCQCNAFLMENELEMANTEIYNLLRSKLMQEIDADFLPATELMSFLITTVFKNGKLKLTPQQLLQFEKVKSGIKFEQFPYLRHYSPYLWLEQKLIS